MKPPVSKSLTLNYNLLLSNVAFKFNLRRFNKAAEAQLRTITRIVNRVAIAALTVGQCRLTVLKPALKAPMVSALDATT